MMFHSKSIGYFSVLLLFVSPLHVFAYTVLWDISNDTFDVYIPSTSQGRYQDLTVDLQTNGFEIQTVSGFSSAGLIGADVAVISASTAASSYNTSMLQSFVAGGGGLLIMANTNNYADYEDVAQLFGISFTDPFYADYTGDPLTSHPVCDNIDSVYFHWGAGLDVSGGSAEAVVSVVDGLDTVVLAASAVYGSGRVIVLSGSSLWTSYEVAGITHDYYGTASNQQFAQNVFESLVVPEPATMLLFAAGGFVLRRKRSR